MPTDRVLLICLGALGDLAWRKFIAHARELTRRHANVEVLFGDMRWSDLYKGPRDKELYWRIGRRCIEQLAEKISEGQLPGVLLKYELDSRPLPWEVDDFFENCLEGDPTLIAARRDELRSYVEEWVTYFMSESHVTGLPRYASSIDQVGTQIGRLKNRDWKVVVFVATPPQAYPSIIGRWKYLADRIVLEKPACGLNPETLLYEGPDVLLSAVAQVPARTQVVTSDHYNAKAIVRVMDRIRAYGIFDSLLTPTKIKRIVVQLLEAAPLPLGRGPFYDGVGGAFGDMVPHLLQAVRAILGLTPAQLKIRLGRDFYWAKYDGTPASPSRIKAEGIPYVYDPHYCRPLGEQTETFVAFDADVQVEGAAPFPLYCRTGKGFLQRKSLRVDVEYGEAGSEMSMLFDLDKMTLTLRDERTGFVLGFGRLSLHDPFESGVPSMAWEYPGIFESLVQSEWGPEALDPRFFPRVEDAAEMCTLVYERLVAERRRTDRIVLQYSANDPATRHAILRLLDHKAHWG